MLPNSPILRLVLGRNQKLVIHHLSCPTWETEVANFRFPNWCLTAPQHLQPWKCSRPRWMRAWATWSSKWHPVHDRGAGTWWSLRSYIPAKVILGFCSVKELKEFPTLCCSVCSEASEHSGVWCGSSEPEIPQCIWSHHNEQRKMGMMKGRWHFSISKVIR